MEFNCPDWALKNSVLILCKFQFDSWKIAIKKTEIHQIQTCLSIQLKFNTKGSWRIAHVY